MAKTTFIVGAGATMADAQRMEIDPLPPLDKGFFARISDSRSADYRPIARYMRRRYGIDISDRSEDSLEAVMSVVYTDVRHSLLGSEAIVAFRAILRAISGELTAVTSAMPADQGSYIYRLATREIADGVSLDDVAFITFNYDLQIEKSLEALEKDGVVSGDGVSLNFPHCYHLPPGPTVTHPSTGDLFESGDSSKTGVAVLKLHGSLNWYSRHNSSSPPINALLKTSRKISITSRKKPVASMTVGGARRTYAFPVIIPPVLNKSAILPTGFSQIWTHAEELLTESERVVIFGYSCPAFDFEAANLAARSLRDNPKLRILTVVDPNPEVLVRYARLCAAKRIAYFDSAESYLS